MPESLRIRKLQFVGHSLRGKEELISKYLLWEPKHGRRNTRTPSTTYLDQLKRGTDLRMKELKNIMEDREEWKKLVGDVRVRSKLIDFIEILPFIMTVSAISSALWPENITIVIISIAGFYNYNFSKLLLTIDIHHFGCLHLLLRLCPALFRPLSPSIKLQILLLCFHTFLTEVVGRSC